MPNIDYLNLKALRKRISCFVLKSANLDIILKLHRKTYQKLLKLIRENLLKFN